MNWLIGHFVADWLFQSSYVAHNKKKSTVVCIIHCLVYTLIVMLFTQWSLTVAPLVFLSHFLFDRWSAPFLYFFKIMRRPDFAPGGKLFPAGWIVTDQIFHLTCLYFINMIG